MIVIGDIHGCFSQLSFLINKSILKKYPNEKNILQCGDFGYFPGKVNFNDIKLPNDVKLYFCDGNHENFNLLETIESNEIYKNVFYQKRGSILNIENKNILFFGGANSIDKQFRKEHINWFSQENITESQINNLSDDKVDIVISHTCPIEFELPKYQYTDKLTDSNRMALSIVLEKYKPKEWCFGHWHLYTEGQYKNTKYYGLNEIFADKSWIKI